MQTARWHKGYKHIAQNALSNEAFAKVERNG
jgi:hypothetical protein